MSYNKNTRQTTFWSTRNEDEDFNNLLDLRFTPRRKHKQGGVGGRGDVGGRGGVGREGKVSPENHFENVQNLFIDSPAFHGYVTNPSSSLTWGVGQTNKRQWSEKSSSENHIILYAVFHRQLPLRKEKTLMTIIVRCQRDLTFWLFSALSVARYFTLNRAGSGETRKPSH